MSNSKSSIWFDLVFILIGIITLLLLFLPEYYTNYRYAGYVGVGVFLVFLVIREVRRKRGQKASGNEKP